LCLKKYPELCCHQNKNLEKQESILCGGFCVSEIELKEYLKNQHYQALQQ
jgi:hypothetical protein